MNANERKWESGESPDTGAVARIARRRFLAWCALLGGGALPLARPAAGADSGRAGPGPRELALTEADFYRPHDLAG